MDAIDSHTGEGVANYAGMIIMMYMVKNTPDGADFLDIIEEGNGWEASFQREIADALCNDHEDMAEDWWSGEYE